MFVPAETVIAREGVWWMFLMTLAERLGLPVFISPLLLAAGAMVAVDRKQFWLVLFATAVPCLLGDAAWYEMGRWKGRAMIAAMCRISFVPDSLEQKAYAGLDRFRGISLLWAKWIPGVAHLAPPVAGAAYLSRPRFHFYNSIGSLVWIVGMLLAGVASVKAFDWMAIFAQSAKLSLGLIAVGSAAMAIYGWRHRKHVRARDEAKAATRSSEQE
jgi:membrane protein DedA with SNARE-associated domain